MNTARATMRFSQRRCKIVGLTILSSVAFSSGVLARCENDKDAAAVICAFDPAKADIRVFWRDPNGEPFGGFSKLADELATRGNRLSFAMNAGMFQPDLSPVGLFVEDGRQQRPINTRASDGNFGMRPNGVFWIEGTRAGVIETSRFATAGLHPTFATQSGPMLVIGGRIHPRIHADGTSAKTRNGVGVCEDGRVRFVISDGPVTFHQFASLFRDRLHCPDALYLDGSISALYAPDLKRQDGWRPLGPIVGVIEKR